MLSHTLDWTAGGTYEDPDYSNVLLIAEVNRARSDDQRSDHQEQLEALIEIGGQLTSMLEPTVIFEKVLHMIDDTLHPTHAALLLVDTEQASIVQCGGSCGADLTFERIMSGLAGREMRAGVSMISDDISQERGFDEPARSRAAALVGWSQIAAPIVSAGRPIGAVLLELAPDCPRPTPEGASLIGIVAQQAAVAIKNAEVYGELAAGRKALQEAHEQLKQTQTWPMWICGSIGSCRRSPPSPARSTKPC